jgi:anti-sigma B factor antagonist
MSNSPKIKVRVRQAGGDTCVLEVHGELTTFAEEQLMAAYNEACDRNVHNVILNFDGLEYMSSSGIGLLVTLLIRAQRQQKRLLACGLNEHYRHIFQLTRLNEAISLHPDEPSALAAAASPAAQGIAW